MIYHCAESILGKSSVFEEFAWRALRREINEILYDGDGPLHELLNHGSLIYFERVGIFFRV